MEPIKVIGRIELPAPAKELNQCLCCGQFKPAKDFPYGQAWALYDCFDCEFDQISSVSFQPPRGGNIEENFLEEWVRDLENDADLDDL